MLTPASRRRPRPTAASPCARSADARGAAARILADVLRRGHSLSASVPTHLATLADPRDRGFAQELAYGTARWLPQLECMLARLLERPLSPKDTDVFALLAIGLYQLLHLKTPPYAAVSATVAASRSLGKPWAGSLINAVLRHYLRDGVQILSAACDQDAVRYAHSEWWLAQLRVAWPLHWRMIVEQNNRAPPMALRVNARHGGREAYLATLAQAGIDANPVPFTSHGVILSQPIAVEALPGFHEGLASVQDGAAQLAAPLLDVRPAQRVLDACAAPGGKTSHLLERHPDLATLVAVDKDAERIALLKSTLSRLRLMAKIVHADAARPEPWWRGRPFDRILLDAPCSGSGVIRRHPDIKLLRRGTDLVHLATEQGRLLAALWPLLARGGKLLYVTCSVLPPENQDQIAAFLKRRADARLLPLDAPWGHDTGFGRQVLPGEADMDGFFYALLAKLP